MPLGINGEGAPSEGDRVRRAIPGIAELERIGGPPEGPEKSGTMGELGCVGDDEFIVP